MTVTETDFLCQGDSITVCCLGRGLFDCQASPPESDEPWGITVSLSPPHLLLNDSTLSSDDSIRPRQHGRRNRHAKLLRRLKVDDELELRRLLNG